MLELKGVTKKFNVLPAVNNASFVVRSCNRSLICKDPKHRRKPRGKIQL